MYSSYGLVDGVLLGTCLTCQSVEGFLEIVHQGLVVEVLIALAVEVFEGFQFFDIRQSDVRCQLEVEGRYGLTSVHLVLAAFH